MIIKIDVRERELYNRCLSTISAVSKFKDIKIEFINLPLGDIIISDGTNDYVIIERKTFSDLASSIKDGRYEEQSYRLNGIDHHNHNIIYLIEGDINKFNTFVTRIDKQTLYSAMTSINCFKGFSVMRSSSLDETAMIVCNMVYKIISGINSGKKLYYSNNVLDETTNKSIVSESKNDNDNKNNNENVETNEDSNIEETNVSKSEKEYCSVVKKVKKDNVTSENIGEIMLCQIPGVSSASALAILSVYKTLPSLIQAIKEDNTCLNNICTTDSNGKKRKISKTTIGTIIKYLSV